MMSRVVPLYGRLLRLHARLLLAIGVGVAAFEVLLVWVFAQMDAGRALQSFLQQILPPDMQRVLFEQFGVGTFEGIIAFGFQHPMFLVAVVAFVIVAGTVPAAERETGFLDLVLARPVPRRSYLLAVLFLVLTGAIALPAAILAGVAAGLAAVASVAPGPSWTAYVPAALVQMLLLMAVGGIGLLAAASARRRGPAAGRVAALVLVLYWLDFVGPFWDLLERVRWISIFAYFDPAAAAQGAVKPLHAAILLGVFGATTAAAFAVFERQDL